MQHAARISVDGGAPLVFFALLGVYDCLILFLHTHEGISDPFTLKL